MFVHTSRYFQIEDRTITSDGRQVVYRARRLLPRADSGQILGELVVDAHDRPDLVATRAFQQPELFWQLCDANAVMDPHEMTARPGRRLRISLAIPGV